MDMEMRNKFAQGLALLQDPFEKLLQEFQPDCLVFDQFFPWTTDVAAKFGIPRLVFTGSSFFHSCVIAYLREKGSCHQILMTKKPFVLLSLPAD
ncbi:hypothetical protein Tsubulata_022093 [Turnera subulata]|uniref:Uncharacterized protein n=1 Tax=Turnera subulata TaxID=218843 RepID=A0A9Q0FE22_9ROSI|nr:hypothetical protein Tsubulata_022093 [Turnera subulata]